MLLRQLVESGTMGELHQKQWSAVEISSMEQGARERSSSCEILHEIHHKHPEQEKTIGGIAVSV